MRNGETAEKAAKRRRRPERTLQFATTAMVFSWCPEKWLLKPLLF
jgi:hypothetical protein